MKEEKEGKSSEMVKERLLPDSDPDYPWGHLELFGAWYKMHKLLDRLPMPSSDESMTVADSKKQWEEHARAKKWIDETFGNLLDCASDDEDAEKAAEIAEIFYPCKDNPVKLVFSLEKVIA